jgi:S1-C subfamily serine protease
MVGYGGTSLLSADVCNHRYQKNLGMRLKSLIRLFMLLGGTLFLGLCCSNRVQTVNRVAIASTQSISSETPFQLARGSLHPLQRRAYAITVKVLAGDEDWGSGILIRRQNNTYWVLTNQHVLWIGDRYRVQTADGRTYTAQKASQSSFGKDDLGLLQFQSSEIPYETAKLGCSLALSVGTPVFATGFPLPLTEFSSKGFKFTTGRISLITQKAFEGGYQVGYSNDIEKGMSGGPVLNLQGEVVAVNGMHQEPLWGDPYVFQDGSKPKVTTRKILEHSSWAIPMETVLRSASLAALRRSHCIAQVPQK